MSRASRRRAEREAKKLGGKLHTEAPPAVKLVNPVTDLFETFIFGNALVCPAVCEPGTLDGKTVVICGAGPSLADNAEEWCRQGDELWAANSALTWLLDRGYPVTHAITVDQTPAMLNEWWTAPDVEYLLASTVHVHLTDHLLRAERRIRFFHNFVGINRPHVEWCECGHDHGLEHHEGMDRKIPACTDCDCPEYRPRVLPFEDWLYMTLYPPTIRAGSGLNTVSRAVDLAIAMGAEKVVVLGADCAIKVNRPLPRGTMTGSAEHKRWLETETVMHADGGNALASGATPITFGGEIDGRWWETKPDMAITAMFLHRMREMLDGKLVLVGDTLPNAIASAKTVRHNDGRLIPVQSPEDFWEMLPAMLDSNGDPMYLRVRDPLLTGEPVPV